MGENGIPRHGSLQTSESAAVHVADLHARTANKSEMLPAEQGNVHWWFCSYETCYLINERTNAEIM